MEREIVYLGHNNTVDLLLKADGVAQDLSAATAMSINVDGTVIMSTDSAAGPIRWTGAGFATGEVRLVLGDQAIPKGEFDAPLVVYDVAQTDGIVWGNVPLEVESNTAGLETYTYTPSGSVNDPIAYDGTEDFWAIRYAAGDAFTIGDRGGVDVARIQPDMAAASYPRWLVLTGAAVPQFGRFELGIIVSTSVYLNNSEVYFTVGSSSEPAAVYLSLRASLKSLAAECAWNYTWDADQVVTYAGTETWDTTGWVAGWYDIAWNIPGDETSDAQATIAPQGDPDDWKAIGGPLFHKFGPVKVSIGGSTTDGDSSSALEFSEIDIALD